MKIYKISKSQRATRIFRIAAPRNYQQLINPQNNSPDAQPDTNVLETNQYQAQEALQDLINVTKETQALENQAAKVEKETGQTGLKENIEKTNEQTVRGLPAFRINNEMGYVTNPNMLRDPNEVSRAQQKNLDNIKELQQQKVNKTKMPS